jgi:hypothetical protein
MLKNFLQYYFLRKIFYVLGFFFFFSAKYAELQLVYASTSRTIFNERKLWFPRRAAIARKRRIWYPKAKPYQPLFRLIFLLNSYGYQFLLRRRFKLRKRFWLLRSNSKIIKQNVSRYKKAKRKMEQKLLRLSHWLRQHTSFSIAKQSSVSKKNFHSIKICGLRSTPLFASLQRYKKISISKQCATSSLTGLFPTNLKKFNVFYFRRDQKLFFEQNDKNTYFKFVKKYKKLIVIDPKKKHLLKRIKKNRRFLNRCTQKIFLRAKLLNYWDTRLYPPTEIMVAKQKFMRGWKRRKRYWRNYFIKFLGSDASLFTTRFSIYRKKQNSWWYKTKTATTRTKSSLKRGLKEFQSQVDIIKWKIRKERQNRRRKDLKFFNRKYFSKNKNKSKSQQQSVPHYEIQRKHFKKIFFKKLKINKNKRKTTKQKVRTKNRERKKTKSARYKINTWRSAPFLIPGKSWSTGTKQLINHLRATTFTNISRKSVKSTFRRERGKSSLLPFNNFLPSEANERFTKHMYAEYYRRGVTSLQQKWRFARRGGFRRRAFFPAVHNVTFFSIKNQQRRIRWRTNYRYKRFVSHQKFFFLKLFKQFFISGSRIRAHSNLFSNFCKSQRKMYLNALCRRSMKMFYARSYYVLHAVHKKIKKYKHRPKSNVLAVIKSWLSRGVHLTYPSSKEKPFFFFKPTPFDLIPVISFFKFHDFNECLKFFVSEAIFRGFSTAFFSLSSFSFKIMHKQQKIKWYYTLTSNLLISNRISIIMGFPVWTRSLPAFWVVSNSWNNFYRKVVRWVNYATFLHKSLNKILKRIMLIMIFSFRFRSFYRFMKLLGFLFNRHRRQQRVIRQFFRTLIKKSLFRFKRLLGWQLTLKGKMNRRPRARQLTWWRYQKPAFQNNTMQIIYSARSVTTDFGMYYFRMWIYYWL